MVVISGIRIGLQQNWREAAQHAAGLLKIKPHMVRRSVLIKMSVDARRRNNMGLVCAVGLELDPQQERAVVQRAARPDVTLREESEPVWKHGLRRLKARPVIAGFGPAGMFAGLLLAREGYRPLLLERGYEVERRVRAVQRFWLKGELNPECNVQFGAGGAGTFSDGKLTTRIHDPRCSYVLRTFVRFGAPEEILYRAKPHIGTDLLRGIVKAIQEEICRLGGEVRFGTRLEDLCLGVRGIKGVILQNGESLPAQVLVLAIGHSARDTFAMLQKRQIGMQTKPFSVGVRVEHLQTEIDRGLFGAYAGHPGLGKGEYQLSLRRDGRAVYTFCMCPGGLVVPAASEPERVVVNGMSEYARNQANANSALVVSVDSRDFGSKPQQAIEFQRRLEQAAFTAGGGGYRAPAQTVGAFLQGKHGLRLGRVEPSYALGVQEAELGALFPEQITGMLRLGLSVFDRRLPGFGAKDAVLTGIETRTSSPVRLSRGENGQALGIAGLYPCGEGAGYAGGIMSAAVDGLRIAEQIMAEYSPFD